MGFEPVYSGKRMDFLLAASLPTELHKLTTNSFSKPHQSSEYAT